MCFFGGGNPEEKGPTGRSKHRWEDNITMDVLGIRCGVGGMD
jgi:hypothetical protein